MKITSLLRFAAAADTKVEIIGCHQHMYYITVDGKTYIQPSTRERSGSVLLKDPSSRCGNHWLKYTIFDGAETAVFSHRENWASGAKQKGFKTWRRFEEAVAQKLGAELSEI